MLFDLRIYTMIRMPGETHPISVLPDLSFFKFPKISSLQIENHLL